MVLLINFQSSVLMAMHHTQLVNGTDMTTVRFQFTLVALLPQSMV
jgi:hypothetical protein